MADMPNDGVILGGRYELIRYLGGGGFGQTYLAQDNHLPSHPCCVVKHLKPTVMDAVSLETAQRLFETEAQVLYRLNGYGQIPRLLAHFQEQQEFYLVQEFIDGDNLGAELLPGNRLTEPETIALLLDILNVLVYIHHHNVIHRDLKPSNLIRRRQDGKIVLIDFGAVKQLTTQIIHTHGHTTRTIAIGSPGYMPSEQMAGRPRFCSDLYAVGMIGIQALTGLHPKSLPEDARSGEMIWRDRVQVTPDLGRILDRLVRYDFRERYQSATEVLSDLAPLVPTRAAFGVLNDVSTSVHSFETRIQTVTDFSGSTAESEVGIDYQPLQTLLIAKQWKAADRETQRLLLKASGREAGQLSSEAIRQLPCRDLYTIDSLWLHHSDGLFGLSVQQDIWRSVGGLTAASYPDWQQFAKNRGKWRINSPWHRFGGRVGWRVKDTWLDYDKLTFTLEAPKGHLPTWHSAEQLAALVSRMETCRPYLPQSEVTRKS